MSQTTNYGDTFLDNLTTTYYNIIDKFSNNYEFLKFIPSNSAISSTSTTCSTTSETSANSSVNMKLIDNNLHTRESCKLAASILFSDIKYNEKKEIEDGLKNGTIKKVPGLNYKIYNNYFADDVTVFLNDKNIIKTGVSTDFTNLSSAIGNIDSINNNGGHIFSVEWVGYFIPDQTGNWLFGTNSDDASYLWLGNTAINDYSTSNSLVNNGGLHGMNYRQNTMYLISGKPYPIRMQFGENWGYRDFILTIKRPDGSQINTNDINNGMLCTFQKDGKNYEVKQMYYSLVENSNENTKNGLFNCYVTNPTDPDVNKQIKAINNPSVNGYETKVEYITLWEAFDSKTSEATNIKKGNYAKIDPNTMKFTIYDSNNNILKAFEGEKNRDINNANRYLNNKNKNDNGILYLFIENGKIQLLKATWSNNNGFDSLNSENIFTIDYDTNYVMSYEWYLDKQKNNRREIIGTANLNLYPYISKIDADNYLVSSDSKLKLYINELGNLVLKVAKKACTKLATDGDGNKFVYTSGNTRFLYNINVDEKMNKMFYANDSNKTLEFTPNNSSVLSYNGYTSIGKFAPSPSSMLNSTKVNSIDECKNTCDKNSSCDNFYFYKTNDGKQWCNINNNNTDNIIPPNSTNLIQPGTNISSSELYIKEKSISMSSNYMSEPIPNNNLNSASQYNNYAYHNVLPTSFSSPHVVGVYSEQEYKDWKCNQNKFLNGTNASCEGFSGNRTYDYTIYTDLSKDGAIADISNNKIGPLRIMTQDLNDNIQRVNDNGNNFDKNKYIYNKLYIDLSNNVNADFNPKFYQENSPLTRLPTLADGINEDVNEMILQQNNMYIVGSITTATLLITAILLAKE
jgi:hypothetical protein